ncbi:hypothetical protein GU926_08575 [Nibribacter ruber]|uniref:Uncharacterized protein n=1 Tax=Nibribacter ruber TaxID=2698458 RepID=A0A6P1NZ23_9BACT|nr:hypothetical protein [Nibribacter ruber]QHL87489.1 hypothetical protein GU926_08575 [Nibribacter ruber]
MRNKELTPEKLYVYQLSNQLTNILYLREDEAELDWMVIGEASKQITGTSPLKCTHQPQKYHVSYFFPTLEKASRHERFRLVLRKSAQKRITPSIEKESASRPSTFILSNARLVDFFWWVSLGSVMTVLYQAL